MTSQQPDPIWVPTGRDIAAADITAFDVLVDLAALAPIRSRS